MVDLLGHGIPIGLIEDDSTSQMVRTISESIRAKSISRRGQIMAGLGGDSSLCLYVVEWSDAFEPSSSVKSNRGSVWLKTVTISPPHDKLHSMTNTYPIAVGPHNVDHEEVEKLFAEELKQFRSGKDVLFYHGKLKKNVKVYLELLCSLQDQSERRSCNYIAMGNSHYTATWGVSLDYSQVYKHLPACDNCWFHLANLNLIRNCTNCTCWDISNHHTELLSYEPPQDYPCSELNSSRKLGAIHISYDSLKGAVSKAHNNYVRGNWSLSNMNPT